MRDTAARHGSITLDFRARADGSLFRLGDAARVLTLGLRDGRLVLRSATPERRALLEVEDAPPLTDGHWHSAAVTVTDAGSRIHLDGHQVFAGTVTELPVPRDPGELHPGAAAGIELSGLRIGAPLSDEELLARARPIEPTLQFAAAALSDYDAAGLAEQRSGSLALRARVRGQGQQGTLLAAAGGGEEQLRLTIDESGIEYAVCGRGGQWRRFRTAGRWTDGEWHQVVLRVGLGAVEIWVDGYRELRAPGQPWFAEVAGLDRVTVGQDTWGVRLWGEVRWAALFDVLLTDPQIKRLSGLPPVPTIALFDRGLAGATSYRIPSLLALPGQAVIAGADQRTALPNDSPNHVNFVCRRSNDGGRSWGPLQTVVRSVGAGTRGASMIDSCLVTDRDTGRVFAVLDHFPGGVGQPNSVPGSGVDDAGRFLLTDGGGRPLAGRLTAEQTNADTAEPATARAFAAAEDLPDEAPRTLRTSYLQLLTSDDQGASWQGPINLNQQVKQPWMTFLGASPGTGIQLAHGRHAGRLVVPVYFAGRDPKRVSAAVIHSDDHGASWRLGGSPNDGRVVNDRAVDPADFADGDAALFESTVVERRDGSLLLLMRNQHPAGRVLRSISRDGGESWGEVTPVAELTEIFSQPNAIAWPSARHPDRVVFANAAQLLPARGSGVLRLSFDGGETWPVARTLNPGQHVYQSMSVLPDGRLAVLWENEYQGLYLTMLPETWFD